MRHGSLFSGIGGFDLAAHWMGWENVLQVEIDPFCQKVLEKNFPDTKRYGDIDQFDGKQYTGRIDVLSGGPPCQPASSAGKRKGEKDDRWKWPEAIRVFGEIRPRIGVFENPDDLLSLDDGKAFERICLSLEDFGYKVETYGIPAACVGAWHERDRVWIIAHSDCYQRQAGGLLNKQQWQAITSNVGANAAHSESQGQQKRRLCCGNEEEQPKHNHSSGGLQWWKFWQSEPGVVRMVHGLPNRVDRIKALGNAVVPQIPFEIFKAIESIQP